MKSKEGLSKQIEIFGKKVLLAALRQKGVCVRADLSASSLGLILKIVEREHEQKRSDEAKPVIKNGDSYE